MPERVDKTSRTCTVWTFNLGAFKDLTKTAGVSDQSTFEILEQICKECDTCQLFKKLPPRPTVGLPSASDYNETVAMELHEWGQNVWYLHLIDEFTCLSAASIAYTNTPPVTMREFFQCWVSIYGTPYSDSTKVVNLITQ